MKGLIKTVAISALLLAVGVAANAKTYTFTPNPSNLNNLDHSYYYTWGFKFNAPAGQTITDAVLTIDSIDNWADEKDNELYIHLLDNPKVGTYEKTDSNSGDQFKNQGTLIAAYHDPKAGKAETLTYDFKNLGLLSTLNSYLSNGVAGFGFDPDCHFYNKGISFKITTATNPAPVPEPSSMLALFGGVSMAGASLFRRRKI